jgi:alkylation response protein AidB-like acyl-CoA dehydrogenase
MSDALDDTRALIRETAADVLGREANAAALRRAIDHHAGRDDALWHTLARDLGWCGLALPETAGGAGLGAREMVVLLEQMGKHLACVPYLGTACVAATVLAQCYGSASADSDSPIARTWLARIARGEASATLVAAPSLTFPACAEPAQLPIRAHATPHGYRLSGVVSQVLDGAHADLLIVPAIHANALHGIGLFAVDANTAGLTRTPLTLLDPTRPIARIELDDVRVPHTALLCTGADATRALKVATWFAALALAAEQLGGAQACLDMTLAYTSTRIQFGRAIASFQAVKHRCAQMLVEIEATRSAVLGAANAWDAWRESSTSSATADLPAPVRMDIVAAKSTANEAFRFCAQEAIQLHGGMGFTWETDAHLYFRRAQASQAQFGTTTELLGWLAAELIDGVDQAHVAG